MTVKLDELDIKIIRKLQSNGRASITELSAEAGSSRQTVSKRLKRLLEEGLIIRGGLDIMEFGYKIADIGLEVRGDDTRREVEHYMKQCPRVLDMFRTPEKANIHLRIWGEDDQTINSTIDSFGDISNVDIVYVHYLGTPIHGNITFNVEPNEEDEAPCGKTCVNCYRYNNAWCLGCPITTHYKTPYWSKS